MKLFYFITLLFSLTSCFNFGSKTELEFEELDRGPASIASFSEEKKLWIKHCSSCHTNEATGAPDKIYVTPNDIKNAIVNVQDMRSIILTDEQIEKIAIFLSEQAIEDISNNPITSTQKNQNFIGSTEYVISKLLALYYNNENSDADQEIKSIINFLSAYPLAFGGSCVGNFEDCKGSQNENTQSTISPNSNIMRRGVIIKICRELHSKNQMISDRSLSNILAYSNLSFGSDGTINNIKSVIDSYIPGFEEKNNELSAPLKKLFDKTLSRTSSLKQAWEVVSYSLCSSPLFDKI